MPRTMSRTFPATLASYARKVASARDPSLPPIARDLAEREARALLAFVYPARSEDERAEAFAADLALGVDVRNGVRYHR